MDKKTCRITIRVTREERDNIKKAADHFGMGISDVIRILANGVYLNDDLILLKEIKDRHQKLIMFGSPDDSGTFHGIEKQTHTISKELTKIVESMEGGDE